MNDRVFVIRTDHALHERIRKLAYLANTSCSAAIRTLLKQQDEEEQLSVLLR
jgi:GTP cyclohydrolase FolE2